MDMNKTHHPFITAIILVTLILLALCGTEEISGLYNCHVQAEALHMQPHFDPITTNCEIGLW